MSDWAIAVPMSGTGNNSATIFFNESNWSESRQLTLKGKVRAGSSTSSIVFTQSAPSYEPTGNTNIIYYTSIDNDIVMPNISSDTVFGANLIANTYSNGEGQMIFDAPVTKIGESAFFNCIKLSWVKIPISVNTIEYYAFSGCTNITRFTMPDKYIDIYGWATGMGVQTVNESYYATSIQPSDNPWCIQLKRNPDCCFEIYNGVIGIAQSACTSLYYTESTKAYVIIPNSVKYIGKFAFHPIVEYPYGFYISTMSNNLVYVDDNAFYECDMGNTDIPASIMYIGENAYADANFRQGFTYPENALHIGVGAFKNCGLMYNGVRLDKTRKMLTGVNPNATGDVSNVIYIEESAHPYDLDYSVPNPIKEGLLYLGGYNISSGRTYYTLPSTITGLGQIIFNNCPNLNNLNFSGTMAQWRTIEKHSKWNVYDSYNNTIPATVVHCTDGDVAI